MKQMVREVTTKFLSEAQASIKYKVTRHQVRKFKKLYGDKFFDSKTVDESQKAEIVQAVLKGRKTLAQVAARYEVDPAMIERWINGAPMLQSKRVGKYSVNESEIDVKVKVDVVRKIQDGKLNQLKAATMLKVTRYAVRNWISTYSVINHDGSICYNLLEKMTPEEKEKELIKKIEDLQKQLEEKTEELEKSKLANVGLETLIQVAEEKLGVKIKKKRGSKQ